MKTAISCIYEQIFLEPELTLLKIALLASLYLSICAGRGKKKSLFKRLSMKSSPPASACGVAGKMMLSRSQPTVCWQTNLPGVRPLECCRLPGRDAPGYQDRRSEQVVEIQSLSFFPFSFGNQVHEAAAPNGGALHSSLQLCILVPICV